MAEKWGRYMVVMMDSQMAGWTVWKKAVDWAVTMILQMAQLMVEW